MGQGERRALQIARRCTDNYRTGRGRNTVSRLYRRRLLSVGSARRARIAGGIRGPRFGEFRAPMTQAAATEHRAFVVSARGGGGGRAGGRAGGRRDRLENRAIVPAEKHRRRPGPAINLSHVGDAGRRAIRRGETFSRGGGGERNARIPRPRSWIRITFRAKCAVRLSLSRLIRA